MEKKILICGHRSFVATGLINKFKTAGIDFDCFSRGKEERNGNVVTGDVFLMHQNSELSENYDTVVNYILLKGKSVEENIQYCQSLLQFCKDKHVKNLIQISSISVYPNESLEVDETSAIEEDYHNKGGYASIKVAVDHYLMEHPIGGLQVSFVRPGYIYTKNQDISKAGILVSKFGLNILLGDKRTTLPLICREKIHEALPDYKYVPMRDVREAMYPEKMTTEQLAEALDEIAEAFDPYEYRDHIEPGRDTVQEVILDLQSGNIGSYISYLKDIVEEECEQSVRAGVLIERLKFYEPDISEETEPMVYVNYCEERELIELRCQKFSDLDALVAKQDKEWYADRNPRTNEPTMTAQMFFTVYYAEKDDKMLRQFKSKIDIGTGNGGILSQLKLQNEMKLTDESWLSFMKNKGNEEFQKYLEELTDMQDHVLPYLQSFCSLEEKGVQERREQQIAEKQGGLTGRERATAETKVKNTRTAGKEASIVRTEDKNVAAKAKKPSIHERLEINKRKIQEKQGKDKPERGADRGVR